MYGLMDPVSNGFFRKRIRFAGTRPDMNILNEECDKSHQRQHVEDSVKVNGRSVKRSQLAGQYPELLCDNLVSLVQ